MKKWVAVRANTCGETVGNGTISGGAGFAMQSLKLSVAVADEKEGKILTDTPLTLWSYGEAIAVFVTRIDDSRTRVEVVSRKKMGTNIFAYSYQDRILDALDRELDIQTVGKAEKR